MMSSWSVDRLNGTYEGTIYVLPSKVRTKVVSIPSFVRRYGYEGTKVRRYEGTKVTFSVTSLKVLLRIVSVHQVHLPGPPSCSLKIRPNMSVALNLTTFSLAQSNG